MACIDIFLCQINWLYVAIPAVLFLSWKLRQPKYKLPPGPIGWPIVGNLLIEKCQKKWKNLRDTYVPKSGQAASRVTRWKYMAVIEFVMPHIQTGKTASNRQLADSAGDGDHDDDAQSVGSSQTASCEEEFSPDAKRFYNQLLQVMGFRGETPFYILLMDMAKKYGPIFTIYIAHRTTIIITNNELALDAFVKKPHDISGRPYFPSGEWLTEGFKDIAFSDPGPAWKLHRKIAAKAFRSYVSGTQLEERLHNCLNKVIGLIKSEKTAFDPYDYDLDDAEFRKLITSVDIANDTLGNGLPEDFVGFLKYLPSKRRKIMRKEFGYIIQLLRQKFKEARASFNPDERRHLIDELILAQSQEDQDEVKDLLTETHLVQTLSDIFFAGTDTSRYTTYWCLLYIAAHPDVQTRIQEEIDSVVGQDRLPCLNDREALAYTDATLHEIMRIIPLGPLGFPHKCLKQTTVGGYDIPEGSDVMVSIWALHNDPTYWKDPEQFNPDRFIENGRLVPKRDSYMPFSAGRRVCLGEAVAKPELFMSFAGLLQHFRVEPETKVDLEPLVEFGLTVFPKKARLTMKARF